MLLEKVSLIRNIPIDTFHSITIIEDFEDLSEGDFFIAAFRKTLKSRNFRSCFLNYDDLDFYVCIVIKKIHEHDKDILLIYNSDLCETKEIIIQFKYHSKVNPYISSKLFSMTRI